MSIELITDLPPGATNLRPLSAPILRRFPYPYRAMLAICSDLDETRDAEVYREQMCFLNTSAMTSMGEGVGLEVGNSIYFDMPPGQFSYWNTDEAGREMVRALIRSGHVDCLHSYGDRAISRSHAARALEELERHNLSLKVWVDHAVAPTNLGADIMRGHGDVRGHPAYHADLTVGHGIRYVWRGRVTSIVGQDQPANLTYWKNSFVPGASFRSKSREAAKQVLARVGHRKYRMHSTNDTAAPATLRDGSSVTEFLRCQPHRAGLDTGDTGDGIAEVLTKSFLDRLVERGGNCILYTHLGKLSGQQRFKPAAIAAFRELARSQQRGEILVTTTRRHLDYTCGHARLQSTFSHDGANTIIHLQRSGDATECQGFTFYVADPEDVQVYLNGVGPLDMVINPPDETGRPSISLPWRRLSFPQLFSRPEVVD